MNSDPLLYPDGTLHASELLLRALRFGSFYLAELERPDNLGAYEAALARAELTEDSLQRARSVLVKHYALLIFLDKEYSKLNEQHRRNAPRNGTLAVGGGDYMDTFFRMEAIRGMQGPLRRGESVEAALAAGKASGVAAVKAWNAKREYQVHRWEGFAEDYLFRLMRRY